MALKAANFLSTQLNAGISVGMTVLFTPTASFPRYSPIVNQRVIVRQLVDYDPMVMNGPVLENQESFNVVGVTLEHYLN